MIREFGRLRRFPMQPAPSRKAPIEAAVPKQTVLMSAARRGAAGGGASRAGGEGSMEGKGEGVRGERGGHRSARAAPVGASRGARAPHGTYCMVSNIAMPAETEPPGC